MKHAVGHIGSTAGALLRASGDETPQSVLKYLEHSTFHVRVAAALAVALGNEKDTPKANAILIKALQHDSPPITSQVLINIGISPAGNRLHPFREALYNLFGSEHRLIRQLAAKRFVQAEDEPVALLIDACQSDDAHVRQSGSRALFMYVAQVSKNGSQERIAKLFRKLKPTYANLLGDHDPEVLSRTLNSLKRFGDNPKELLPKLEELAQSKNPQVADLAKEVIEGISQD